MKNKLGYLVLVFEVIFCILFIIAIIFIFALEPNSWYDSPLVFILLLLAVIFGGSGFALILFHDIKENISRVKKARCKNCDNRNRSSAIYCEKCGEKL